MKHSIAHALRDRVRPSWAALFGWLLLAMTPAGASAADQFLDPEVAFKLSARALDAQRIELNFDVASGYHLYRDKFNASITPAPAGTDPSADGSALQIPRGTVEFDATFQKDVEVFKAPVTLVLPLAQPVKAAFKLVVGNQGCADEGLCYPPMERAFKVEPGAGGLVLTALTEDQAQAWSAAGAEDFAGRPAASDGTGAAGTEPGQFASALQSRDLLKVAGVFLLAGLLLSFTPCVLPMMPILSSIIVGQRGTVSRARGFSLALAYSLGMALVYTAIGMAAGLAGEGLAAALQNAWVLGAFALLLATLSLSMFGVYELQMPSSVQSRITEVSGRLQGGQHRRRVRDGRRCRR